MTVGGGRRVSSNEGDEGHNDIMIRSLKTIKQVLSVWNNIKVVKPLISKNLMIKILISIDSNINKTIKKNSKKSNSTYNV